MTNIQKGRFTELGQQLVARLGRAGVRSATAIRGTNAKLAERLFETSLHPLGERVSSRLKNVIPTAHAYGELGRAKGLRAVNRGALKVVDALESAGVMHPRQANKARISIVSADVHDTVPYNRYDYRIESERPFVTRALKDREYKLDTNYLRGKLKADPNYKTNPTYGNTYAEDKAITFDPHLMERRKENYPKNPVLYEDMPKHIQAQFDAMAEQGLRGKPYRGTPQDIDNSLSREIGFSRQRDSIGNEKRKIGEALYPKTDKPRSAKGKFNNALNYQYEREVVRPASLRAMSARELEQDALPKMRLNYKTLRNTAGKAALASALGGAGGVALYMANRKKNEQSGNSGRVNKSMAKRATMEKGWLRDAARSLARTGHDLGESAAIRIRKPISEARMAAMVTPINAGSYHTVRALEKLRVIRPETARVLKENIINGARVDTNQMMDFAAAHNDAIDRAVSRGGRFLGSDPSKLKMRTAGSNPTSDIKFLMRNGVAPEKIAPLLEGKRSTLTDAEALSGHEYQLGRHKVISGIQNVLLRGQRMRRKPITDNVFLQMMDEHRFNRKLADRYERTKPKLRKSMSAITKSADMEKPSMPSTRRDIKHTNKYF